MSEFQAVEELIKTHLSDAYVSIQDLTGTRDHLGLTIASDQFIGKPLIQQHQMIMDILKEKLGSNEIHAVKIKTLTLDKARENGLIS
jgi:stress-induced morphogen